MVRSKCRRDKRVQLVNVDQPGMKQLQVGQDPGRGVGQDRHYTGAASDRLTRRAQVQHQPVPAREPHGDDGASTALSAQQQCRLGQPPVHGARADPGRDLIPCEIAVRRPMTGPLPQFTGPAHVP